MKTPEQFSQKQGPQPYSQPPGMPAGQNMPMPSHTIFPPQNQPPQPGADGSPMPLAGGALQPRVTRNLNVSQTGNLNPTAGGFAPPRVPTARLSMPPKPPRYNPTTVGKVLLFVGLALLVVTTGVMGYSLLSGDASSANPSTHNSNPKPTPTPTPTVHMQHTALATKIMQTMSLDDEIAQLLMVERYVSNDDTLVDIMISQQHVGAVIMYRSALQTRTQVQSDTKHMQSNSNIPLLISIDEEGRSLCRLQYIYGQYQTGVCDYRKDADDIRASGDLGVATTEGADVAKDLLSMGMNMNLAPVVDISGPENYIGYDGRSFGTTADQVIKYAGPYLKAMQQNGVVGTLKHFPGLGSVPDDPHAELPVYAGTTDQLYQTDLVPFKHFIQSADAYEKAYVVMPTDMLVPTIDSRYPVELSRKFITDILRNELGFQGVILTDSLTMGGVKVDGQFLDLAQASVLAFQAGNDMLEGASTPDHVQNIIDATKVAITNGTLSKAQIDASVVRVLTLKMDFNIMPAKMPEPATATPIATQTP